MTIGIGVLATSEEGRASRLLPDTAILIADTMGSYDDADSHARLHKAFMFPEIGLYAVAANRVDRAGELLSAINTLLATIPRESRSFGDVVRCVASACYGYKREKFITHEFPKLRIPPEDFDPRTCNEDLNAVIQEKWREFDIGCDLVIAAFCGNKTAALLHVDGMRQEVSNMMFPGFCAIGSGSDNARFWLSRRQHAFGNLPLRAAYHAYEAKLMAEGSAHVNEHLDIIVATHDCQWFSTTHHSKHGFNPHPEINLKNLKLMLRKYGTKSTERIGGSNK